METTKEKIVHLSQPDVQNYLFEHEQEDERQLVLKHKTLFNLPSSLIAEQISGRRKAKHKLPPWYTTKGIIYPPSLNLEQSSSEATAKYKSSIILKGKIAADLTGGFGIDSFFLSQRFEKLFYVEPDEDLLGIAKHNHHLLGVNNIEYITSTAEEFIEQSNEKFHLIFIDPSRRNKQQKVFKLADCVPNVIDLLPHFLEKAENIIIKNSPLLDIQQGCRELKNVQQVIVVAVDNECKELLFVLNKNTAFSPLIKAIDLDNNGVPTQSFSFHFHEEKSEVSNFSPPLQWLYEPNAAILKAGAFKTVAERYSIFKLHPNTHLYTSAEQIKDFPGRTFKVMDKPKLDKKLKEHFPQGQTNILTRNYPLSVEEIKKKTGLTEGGELFLICTQSEKEKHAIIAERIKIPTL